MIKNILKQLWNQRRSNFWIALEIALVFVFLWFILNFIFKQYEAFNRPMGFNIEDVYEVKINNLPASAANYVKQEEFGTTSNEDLLTLLSRLRRVEGIEAVAPTSLQRLQWYSYVCIYSWNGYDSKGGNVSCCNSGIF